MSAPQFKVGQLIQHKKYGYRGVIFDVDLDFQQSEQWYEQVAHSRPPKDKPWYRVLVHGARHDTYVAEQHLAADAFPRPIAHPALDRYFDEFKEDHYARTRDLN